MAEPILLTDDTETKAKKIAASAGLAPAAQVNVSGDTAAPVPVMPNPAAAQTPVAPGPNAGLTPEASPVQTPALPPVVLNDQSIAPAAPPTQFKPMTEPAAPVTPATAPSATDQVWQEDEDWVTDSLLS